MTLHSRFVLLVGLLLLLVLGSSPVLFSQGTDLGTIRGTVSDSTGAVVANAVLKVSSTAENVVVTAEAPIIDNSDQTISNTINSDAVINLPRDSRDVYDFLYLNPNITQADSSGELKLLGFQSYGANFTIDGQRSTN